MASSGAVASRLCGSSEGVSNDMPHKGSHCEKQSYETGYIDSRQPIRWLQVAQDGARLT